MANRNGRCRNDLDKIPMYPENWNGCERLVIKDVDDEQKVAVNFIFDLQLGKPGMVMRDQKTVLPENCASNEEVCKGLIRRLRNAPLYFYDGDKQQSGYCNGGQLLQNIDFFWSLFSGIHAETQMGLPHYGYTIRYCDELMGNVKSSSNFDPMFTIGLLSLLDVLKNIYEGAAKTFDTGSCTAYGWLNIWLLGVQKILICEKIPSSQHLKMMRNAIAHHQFSFNHNYIQLFNRSDNSQINWMIRITLGDLFEVQMVLKMLNNSGYILNTSHDEENMNNHNSKINHVRTSIDKLHEIVGEISPANLSDILESNSGERERLVSQLMTSLGNLNPGNIQGASSESPFGGASSESPLGPEILNDILFECSGDLAKALSRMEEIGLTRDPNGN